MGTHCSSPGGALAVVHAREADLLMVENYALQAMAVAIIGYLLWRHYGKE